MVQSRWLALGLGLMLALAVPACTADADDDDDETSSTEDNLTVTSADTALLLAFVNDTNNDKPEFVKAGLTNPAATALVARRAGPDATDATSDDFVFQTIADVDAIPGIGAASIKKLIAYAKSKAPAANGDPFDDATCDGPTMTTQEALQRFQPGASVAELGTFETHIRMRDCNVHTGCGPWLSEPNFATYAKIIRRVCSWAGPICRNPQNHRLEVDMRKDKRTGPVKLKTTGSSVSLEAVTISENDFDAYIYRRIECDDIRSLSCQLETSYSHPLSLGTWDHINPEYYLGSIPHKDISVRLTNSCYRTLVTFKGDPNDSSTGSFTEGEAVFISHF